MSEEQALAAAERGITDYATFGHDDE